MSGSTDNPDILTGLNQVIQALNDLVLTSNCTPQIINNVSMTCNCGSGGAGGTSEPSDTDTGDPADPQGDPPSGFDTWTEYHTYKCNVATKIVDDVLDDVQWFQTVNLYSLNLASLAGALLSPVPGDELVLLLGLLILLASEGYIQAVLQDMEDAIQNNYDDLVCTLFGAPNATQAESDLENDFAAAIDAETIDTIARWQGKSAFNYLANPANINRLFDKDEALTGKLPTGDCSECDECLEVMVLTGIWDPQTNRLTATWEETYWSATVAFNKNESGYCGPSVTMSNFVEVSGSPYALGGNGYRIRNQAGTLIYTDTDTPPSSPISNCGSFSPQCIGVGCGGQFIVQFDFEDDT